MFQTYVSKPTEVRAVYWDGTDDVLDTLSNAGCKWRVADPGGLRIVAGVEGAQGWVDVPQGHYIIDASRSGVYDFYHFYPCERVYFEIKYEPKSVNLA